MKKLTKKPHVSKTPMHDNIFIFRFFGRDNVNACVHAQRKLLFIWLDNKQIKLAATKKCLSTLHSLTIMASVFKQKLGKNPM
jgi:hypothetical protein